MGHYSGSATAAAEAAKQRGQANGFALDYHGNDRSGVGCGEKSAASASVSSKRSRVQRIHFKKGDVGAVDVQRQKRINCDDLQDFASLALRSSDEVFRQFCGPNVEPGQPCALTDAAQP